MKPWPPASGMSGPSLAILDLGLPTADGKASSPHYASAGNLIIVLSSHEREAEKIGRLICAHS
jgi:DNA-binding response OmpR family regulator